MSLSLFMLIFQSAFAAIVINQSVGMVDKEIVTSREVQIATVIENIIDTPVGKTISVPETQLKDSKFNDYASSYLMQKAAVREAENLSVNQAEESQIKEVMGRLEKATAGKAFWSSLEADDKIVNRITTDLLVAKNFIKIKAESMLGVISDSEAQSYFEKNRLKFGSSPFESFKDNIKTFLGKQQREERLRSWFEVLKKKYKVRNTLIENAKTPQETAASEASQPRK